MNVLALAWRNLSRNRRRSLATISSMMIGSVSILLFGGYVQNIIFGMQTGYVRSEGHLQLQHRDHLLYGSGDPTAYGIAHYDRIIELLRSDPVLKPMLTMVTPSLEFGGIAGNFAAGASRTVGASGIVVANQNVMLEWNDYGFPGQRDELALTGTREDAAVIGTGVARVLHLCVPLHVKNCPPPHQRVAANLGPEMPHDVGLLAVRDMPGPEPTEQRAGAPLELLAATTQGAPNVARLQVVKAVAAGIKEVDDVYVEMHLRQAQRLLYGAGEPEVTAISLQLRHTAMIPAAKARVEALLATTLAGEPLAVYDFQALNPYYGQTIALFTTIFGFIAVLIGAIVMFTVANTMNAAVVERTVEIGTLRAIGLRRSGIRRLFVGEAALLGVLGTVLGVVAALAIAAAINHSGLTWTPPGRVDPVHLRLRVWGEIPLVAGTALGLIGIAIVSAWWPARRAARLPVVEALRHV